MLTSQGMKCVSISGNTFKTARQEAVTIFTRDPKCTVFLLTMGSGAVGLTLTAANVVYLLEPSHSLVRSREGGREGGGQGSVTGHLLLLSLLLPLMMMMMMTIIMPVLMTMLICLLLLLGWW